MTNALEKLHGRLPTLENNPEVFHRQSGKRKRVPPKIKEVVKLLLTGACTTQRAACERVGIADAYFSRKVRQLHVLNYIDSEVRSRLAQGKLVASARLIQLIHAKSEHVSLDAAAQTLGINGIAPPNQNSAPIINISNTVSAGYVIDIAEPPTIEHEPRSGE